MSNIVRSFSYKQDKIQALEKFEEIAKKEGKKFSELLVEVIEDFDKKHGDGNPGFTLDHYQDPNFKAVPAVFRDAKTWQDYLTSRNKTELKEFESQMNVLINAYNQASKKVF